MEVEVAESVFSATMEMKKDMEDLKKQVSGMSKQIK